MQDCFYFCLILDTQAIDLTTEDKSFWRLLRLVHANRHRFGCKATLTYTISASIEVQLQFIIIFSIKLKAGNSIAVLSHLQLDCLGCLSRKTLRNRIPQHIFKRHICRHSQIYGIRECGCRCGSLWLKLHRNSGKNSCCRLFVSSLRSFRLLASRHNSKDSKEEKCQDSISHDHIQLLSFCL